MWSLSFVLSLTVVLHLNSQAQASCDPSMNTTICSKQLGLNTSYPIQDCSATSVGSCNTSDVITLRGCNTTLPSTSTYIVLCTANGLKFYTSDNQCMLNETGLTGLTSALCRDRMLNCSGGNLPASTVTTILRRMNNCTSTPSTTASPALKLIPNPVGPEAITAIVVIICLVITGILAGFFFWPKCHIADPAAEALKKATKPAAAKAASAAAASAASRPPSRDARVVYEPDQRTAHIKLPSIPGPSAA